MWRQVFAAFLLSGLGPSASACALMKRVVIKEVSNREEITTFPDNVTEIQGAFAPGDVIETKLTRLSQAIQALPSTIEDLVQKRLDKIAGSFAQNDAIGTKLTMLSQEMQAFEELMKERLDKITAPARPSRPYDDKFVRDEEGYLLAFRLTAGIGKPVLSKYRDMGNNDDEDELMRHSVPCGCKTPNGSLFCDRHYRSQLLDLWPRIPVEKAKVSLYKEGVEQRRFLFDGKNSDFLSFFQQARLQEDPYTDLSALEPSKPLPDSFFSVAGDARYSRAFFVNNNYGGCENDAGWMVVGDAAPSRRCPWEEWHQNRFPFILYADTVSGIPAGAEKYMKSVWHSGKVAKADVLTISIKLRDKEECQL